MASGRSAQLGYAAPIGTTDEDRIRHLTVALPPRDAAIAGLTLPWSSGVVEGHVNRIKMLKRQMSGRGPWPSFRFLYLQQPSGAMIVPIATPPPLLTERPLVSRTIRIAALASAALAVVTLATPSQAASTTGALMITHVRPNAAGSDIRDGRQVNVNGEYFIIKNVTTRTVNTGGYVPDITTNTYGRALPSYNLSAGAKAYVHTGSGRHYRDSSGWHHIYRGYARHVLLNTSTAKNPDLRLKKPGSPDNNTATGSITTCNWNTAANGTTYAC